MVRALSKSSPAWTASRYFIRFQLVRQAESVRKRAGELLGTLPQRPPTFCIGCPERPVFSAMKLVAQDVGPPARLDGLGCHASPAFEPFSQGNTLAGLRDEPRERRGRRADVGKAASGDHGRRRFLAYGLLFRRRLEPLNGATACW